VSTTREIARIAGWANDITARRSRGEEIPAEELLDYQRAKVALLETIAEHDRSDEANETLAAARAQLGEMESADAG
jgi:hypothetical protein